MKQFTLNFNINTFIIQYGYLALFIGSLIEGETIILIGGIAVNQGLLNFYGSVIVVIIGGFIGDQFLFWIGRIYGDKIFKKFNQYNYYIIKLHNLIHKYPNLIVIGVRFMYGLRIIGPIIIGNSYLRSIKFMILNVIGTSIWATFCITIGYFSGAIIVPWIYKFNHSLKIVFLISIFTILFIFLLNFFIRAYKKK
ncbi:DedA family protein [Candidatus Tachikawaea gelatinosa]|uniref:SNARE associated Golgi protein-like protein n=1 Tax=Candidatus Tachikawaea gelatinosa TaxID=1410383 RepID=A0A090BWJ6_9ENTR|nr:DedA family protein [Candidatus Tachikawaea gelatinosa]BAP58721.1 SNARE associated Golgi protein-like protein [Candidatus Tachikawaea gelatinosa]